MAKTVPNRRIIERTVKSLKWHVENIEFYLARREAQKERDEKTMKEMLNAKVRLADYLDMIGYLESL